MAKYVDSPYIIRFDEPARSLEWAKSKNLKSIETLTFAPHLVAGTKDTYTYDCYIGPLSEDDKAAWRESDLKEWKGKTYCRIGTSYNVKGLLRDGSILEVHPIRIEVQNIQGKKAITWMFPRVGIPRPEKHEPDTLEFAYKLAALGTAPMTKTIKIELATCPEQFYANPLICKLLTEIKIWEDGVWKEFPIDIERLKYPVKCPLANFYKCRRIKAYYYSFGGENNDGESES